MIIAAVILAGLLLVVWACLTVGGREDETCKHLFNLMGRMTRCSRGSGGRCE